MESLAERIRERRRSLKLNQLELAQLSGTSERFIRELEHGKTSVRLDKALAVLTTLGLELTTVARGR